MAEENTGEHSNNPLLFDRVPIIDVSSTERQALPDLQGTIELRNVHFAYRPEQPNLNGISLKILPGRSIALVGASGSGKSTIISLLERFYDPTSGSIFVDGKDVSILNLHEYRKHLALVLQEPMLYSGTIRENLLLSSTTEDINEDRLIQACKDANIYSFIASLPSGFATPIGSKGAMLSGGQKQRIAIARALLRNPKILLLDEATSALLDSESESVMQTALEAAARGRTTIAVAHRLSTVRNADVIYVIDDGRIVESGTHVDFIAYREKYFELVEMQSEG
ncbi:Putative Type 1 protein exporter [Septoria linicola]|uniref:Type 1 protein exporter n=1 Tax=Septoria linicola TaxID=215465 RepID=A0A9Q9EQH1_9PEZI|nr:putative Type 1 protein exporter [Septoria linicola]USW57543.1 Putative Type 1 protein exporter [Septoria linicola]